MVPEQPSLLFIDAYDSFTNNIVALLSTNLSCSVRVIHIDTPGLESDEALRQELQNYDAVICGPGPGDPSNDKDVGLMKRIWRLADDDLLPVLGICLGFQSLALEFGGKIKRLNQGLHGIVQRIKHIGQDSSVPEQWQSAMFNGVGKVEATLYHSLCVDLGQNITLAQPEVLLNWIPLSSAPQLQPLAWVDEPYMADRQLLMAIKHTIKPFWGLQYHPESICTNSESTKIIRNWFREAESWNYARGRRIQRHNDRTVGQHAQRPSLMSMDQRDNSAVNKKSMRGMPVPKINQLEFTTLRLPVHISAADIVEILYEGDSTECLFLESSNATVYQNSPADVRGRYSIIGLDLQRAPRVEYSTGNKFYTLIAPSCQTRSALERNVLDFENQGSIWQALASLTEDRKVVKGNPDTPFWGGFLGYTTYELGLEGIDVNRGCAFDQLSSQCQGVEELVAQRPDLYFAWISTSVVVDHWEGKVHVQTLSDASTEPSAYNMALFRLKSLFRKRQTSNAERSQSNQFDGYIYTPDSKIYQQKVEDCQSYIREGNSYELCLTDQTQIVRARRDPISDLCDRQSPLKKQCIMKSDGWAIYQGLRSRQPAPMASFIRLGDATFISASPERFLKWDNSGKCELRPMKGTVKKTDIINTLSQAEALLQVPKEQAENLMIVDLVRHDLHGVCGAGNVQVPRLMVVEEYASVFQMITVVEGQLPVNSKSLDSKDGQSDLRSRYTGIDVLAASLPPGSMTGAPKKRSCEILQQIECGHERSLYSGVVGYIDVGGRGDFSVNIRCLFRWDDEALRPGQGDVRSRIDRLSSDEAARGQEQEIWHVGAGGAVTALSSPVGEREEMQTKLSGTLDLFR